MEKTIEVVATEILVDIFRKSGCKINKAGKNRLQVEVKEFIDKSTRITKGDYSGGYAVISRRIMKSVHKDKRKGPSDTKLGKSLFRLEKKLIKAMEELHMYDHFDRVPQFTLLVTKDIANTFLLYSKDFGYNLEIVAIHSNQEKEKG